MTVLLSDSRIFGTVCDAKLHGIRQMEVDAIILLSATSDSGRTCSNNSLIMKFQQLRLIFRCNIARKIANFDCPVS